MDDNSNFDDLAQAGLAALIARWHFVWLQFQEQEAIRDKAAKKSYELNQLMGECKRACRLFGFDPDDKERWSIATKLYGAEARRLFNKIRLPEMAAWESEPSSETPQVTPTVEKATQDQQPAREHPERPTLKEIALSRLKAAGNAGSKAADIREFIQKNYGAEIHEKSVGMTLYRLSEEGLVRREGHTWFIVQETMNPGATTPGSQ
jgi:hypothetical protein